MRADILQEIELPPQVTYVFKVDIYDRARELCRQMGETPQLGPVLVGLRTFYVVRADYETSRELGEQILNYAQRRNDAELLLQAHQGLGMAAFYIGALTIAQEYFDQGIFPHKARQHRTLAYHQTHDLGLQCLSYTYTAWDLCLLGFPHQALERIAEARALAHELSHPFSLARALHFIACTMQIRRDVQGAQESALAAMKVSTEHEFVQWLAGANMIQGWAVAAQGQREAGIAQLCQGLTSWQTTGAAVGMTYFLALLADVYCQGKQTSEGLSVVAEGLALVDKHGEGFTEAEIYRLKGELLLQQSSENVAEAESCFNRAIAIAQDQSAKFWELRAATSLARLWQSQDKRQDAYDLLAPIYNWFTKGFDTADLQEAKALLVELS